MTSAQFTDIFRTEHRKVRDALLDLIDAFRDGDREKAQSLLSQIATLTGPHFRYEEESLYPSLTVIFGDKYIEKLITDHDWAIGAAKKLVELAGSPEYTPDVVASASGLARGILPHVSDCDGLSIMVERLPEEKVKDILDTRLRSLDANLNLIEWADTVRERAAVTL